ncbi:MAG: alpha/beta-hydrolase family protein [Rhodobacteraceae bacterium]|nr:alpha/beta-hydrolase family protein [Paracoccaceae bacterium]
MTFLRSFLRSISVVGLLVGLILFSISLTPSLLPRIPLAQGVLSGVVFTVGYGVGRLTHWLWLFLEIREFQGKFARNVSAALLALAAGTAIATLTRMSVWQNSIRDLMGMAEIDSAYPVSVLSIAILTATLVLLITRVLIWTGNKASAQANRVLPHRLSVALGVLLVAFVVITAMNKLVISSALHAMDELFATIDEITDEGSDEPAQFADSLIHWDDIGRNGKRFLTDGPDKSEIAEMTGRSAKQPIRVIAGYNSAETVEQRAAIAVTELDRQGGFDRPVLIIATPTGTGWLDPAAMQPVAFMHNGDLAIVSMQYSYLPSWLTLMIDPDLSRESARALFDAVYARWSVMPQDTRPRLYLFGLSLGALGSEASADLISLLTDPINGALWAGPPFASTLWPRITANRNPGSPQWRPLFRDSSLIRFMTHDGFTPGMPTQWGPIRIVYLQHPSDPMSFFSPSLAFSAPDWLGTDRGSDISPHFTWNPLVTFFQVGFDIPMATTVPPGHGHTFTPAGYIEAWLAVTAPDNWTKENTKRLKARFADFSASPI